jgi:hypothetical protein
MSISCYYDYSGIQDTFLLIFFFLSVIFLTI